ncbi:MAG: hypothetical protein ACOYOB_18345 [Myxococcota bacterium]
MDYWPMDDERRGKVKPVSLGMMVGQLRNDIELWWRKPENGGARAALAAFLDLDEADAFPNLGQEHLGEWGFPEFSALRPQNPASEVPVKASLVQLGTWEPPMRDDVVGVTLLPMHPTWVTVPDGGGKSFAVRWARQRLRHVLTVDTLADAADHLAPLGAISGGLLVEVRRADSTTDGRALAALAAHERFTVLASFPRPGQVADLGMFHEPTVAANPDEVPAPQSAPVWQDWHWVPSATARRELIRWACTRVPPDSLLAGGADQVLEWLEEVDPDAAQFGSPSNVLWLLARVHHTGMHAVRRDGLEGLAHAFVEQLAADAEAKDPGLAAWLRDTGIKVLAGICSNRWHDLTLPVDGAITEADWQHLVPAEWSRGDADALRADLLAKLDTDTIVARFDRPRPDVVVARLQRAGILRSEAAGVLELGPPWLSLYFMRLAANADLAIPGETDWGRLCYAVDRRRVIDAELVELAADDDVFAAHLAALPIPSQTPAAVGAVDAWFVALGKRLMSGSSIGGRIDLVHRVALAETDSLAAFYRGTTWRLPLSRRAHDGAESGLHDWLAAAWALSMTVPAPDQSLPGHMDWVLPGWTKPNLADAPRDLPLHGRHERDFLNWIAKMALERPADHPAETALQEFWTGWALAMLYGGGSLAQAVAPPSRNSQSSVGLLVLARGATVRAAGPQKWDQQLVAGAVLSWPDDVRERAIRSLSEVVLLRARPVRAGLEQWQQGACLDLRTEALKLLKVEDLVEALEAPDGYARGDVEYLIRTLPARFHLPVVAAVANLATRDLALISSGAANRIALSPDAMEWIALNTTWPAARSWAEKQPQRALAWLKQGGLAHPLAEHVLPALPAQMLDEALAWVEGLPRGEHDALVRWWAMFAMSVRPDLLERWWGLCARASEP